MKKLIYKLFLAPTSSGFLEFFRYLFVGGTAFVVDAGSMWIFEHIGLHYLWAAVPAFILGLITNYVMSKWLVFKDDSIDKVLEFIIYAVIGVIGLGITELIMFLLTDLAGLYFLVSKVIAAAIVTFWNYFGKKAVYTVKARLDDKKS